MKSTKEALQVVNEINENNTPLPDTAQIALCDISKMYPNVDVEDLVQLREDYRQTHLHLVCPLQPLWRGSESGVKFMDNFYLPNRGHTFNFLYEM